MTSQRLLEVCVDTPEGLLAAVRGGADRIELCAALASSGLTPPSGLMRLAVAQPVPVYVMIRPRAGDFCFTATEVDTMRADIDQVRALGLQGVVLGANHASGELDAELLGRLLEQAGSLKATLHRAFDVVPDLEAALETAIELGFERVLTSGGAKTALEGAATLRSLAVQGANRIAVMAGSGVTPATIPDLVRTTGLDELHGSFRGPVVMNARAAALGFVNTSLEDTDEGVVQAAVAALNAA